MTGSRPSTCTFFKTTARRSRLGHSTEVGIAEMLTRMQSGRLKVARNLIEWAGELQSYHRKDRLVVKINDDLMSTT